MADEEEDAVQEMDQEEVSEEAPEAEAEAEEAEESRPSRRSRRGRRAQADDEGGPSSRNQGMALMLSLFGGMVGLDRLYLGSLPMAALKLIGTVGAAVLLLAPVGLDAPIAIAAAFALLSIAAAVQIHDLALIGMGRMHDGSGRRLGPEQITDVPHSQTRAFSLSLIGGCIGQDRFYLGSGSLGVVKAAAFGVGALLLLLSGPFWRGWAEYPIAAKFSATAKTGTAWGKTAALPPEAHELTLIAWPSETDAAACLKANDEYWGQVLKAEDVLVPIGSDEAGNLPDFGAAVPAAAPAAPAEGAAAEGAAADATAEGAAPAEGAAAPAAAAAAGPVNEGTRTEVRIPFNGVNQEAVLAAEKHKLTERMAAGILAARTSPLSKLLGAARQLPLAGRNAGLFTVACLILGGCLLLWIVDLLLIGGGSAKDGKGKPLGQESVALVHCSQCHELMAIDLSQKNLRGLVCRYEECTNQASPPTRDVVEAILRHGDEAAHRSLAGIACGLSAIACGIAAGCFQWPDSAWQLAQDPAAAGATGLLFGAMAVLGLAAMIHATKAESPRPIVQF